MGSPFFSVTEPGTPAQRLGPESGNGTATLYAGTLVTLLDHHCPGHDSLRDEVMSDAFEIVVVRRGIFVRESMRTRTIADSTVATFWNPNQIFRVRHPTRGRDSSTIVRFTESAMRGLLESVCPSAAGRTMLNVPSTSVPIGNRPFMTHCMLRAAARRAGVSAIALEESSLALAQAILRDAFHDAGQRDSAWPGRRRAVEYAARVREFVAGHYLEDLSLERIAREVCCSPFHLSRVMVATQGVTVHRLIVRLRLRDALQRLLDTRESISAIALQTSFSSHSHFGAAFRREFGLPPGALRGSHCGARTLRALGLT